MGHALGTHQWAHPTGEVVEEHAGFWDGSPEPLHGDAASVPSRMGHAAYNNPHGCLHADGALAPPSLLLAPLTSGRAFALPWPSPSSQRRRAGPSARVSAGPACVTSRLAHAQACGGSGLAIASVPMGSATSAAAHADGLCPAGRWRGRILQTSNTATSGRQLKRTSKPRQPMPGLTYSGPAWVAYHPSS